MSSREAGVPLRHGGGFAGSGRAIHQEHGVAVFQRIARGVESRARQGAPCPGSGIELAFDDERLTWIVGHYPAPAAMLLPASRRSEVGGRRNRKSLIEQMFILPNDDGDRRPKSPARRSSPAAGWL